MPSNKKKKKKKSASTSSRCNATNGGVAGGVANPNNNQGDNVSSSSASPVAIRSIQLQGHQGPVLCLDHACNKRSNSGDGRSFLLSGSEDKTARLWDLRQRRASLCIPCDDAVTAVTFAPDEMNHEKNGDLSEVESNSNDAVNNNIFAQEYTIFVAVDNQILGYDLRNAKGLIVAPNQEHGLGFTLPLGSMDEINQLAFGHQNFNSPKRRGGKQQRQQQQFQYHTMAAADDAGQIRLTMDWQRQLSQVEATLSTTNIPPSTMILEHEPVASATAASMITSAVFQPQNRGSNNSSNNNNNSHSNPLLLATGSTDCVVTLWDVSRMNLQSSRNSQTTTTDQTYKPQKCLSRQVMELTTTGVNQVCNPPMVHSLDWSHGHSRLLAAGLGDGSLCIMSAENRKLAPLIRNEEAHTGAVACVEFPDWKANSTQTSNGRLLLTAGNDGMLVAWDLGSGVDMSSADPTLLFSPALQLGGNKDDVEKWGGPVDEEALLLEAAAAANATKTLFAISHTKKPNWLCSTPSDDPILPSTIFLADTSNDITGYQVPMRHETIMNRA